MARRTPQDGDLTGALSGAARLPQQRRPGSSGPAADRWKYGSAVARTELEVRRVGPGETAAVAATLARAFEHDRVMRWLTPGDGRLERGFALYLERLWLVHDSCFTTDDRLAAACWLPPAWPLSWARFASVETKAGGLG